MFLGKILRGLRLEISVCSYNPILNYFCSRGSGVISVSTLEATVNTRRKLYETNYVREFGLCTRICCLCMLCVCCVTCEPDEKYLADLFFIIHTFNTCLLVFMYSYINIRPPMLSSFSDNIGSYKTAAADMYL